MPSRQAAWWGHGPACRVRRSPCPEPDPECSPLPARCVTSLSLLSSLGLCFLLGFCENGAETDPNGEPWICICGEGRAANREGPGLQGWGTHSGQVGAQEGWRGETMGRPLEKGQDGSQTWRARGPRTPVRVVRVLQRDTCLPETRKVMPCFPIPRTWSCCPARVSTRVDSGPLESRTGPRSQPHVHSPSDTARHGVWGQGWPLYQAPSPPVPRRSQTLWPPHRALNSP